jgi:hypothetical protein
MRTPAWLGGCTPGYDRHWKVIKSKHTVKNCDYLFFTKEDNDYHAVLRPSGRNRAEISKKMPTFPRPPSASQPEPRVFVICRGSSSICVDDRANATTWPGSPPHRGPPRPPGGALAGGLSLRMGSAGEDQGSWLHRKPLVSGASADQMPSRWRRRDGPRGPEHFFHGAGNRADRRSRALDKASTASDGASDEPPGVELIGAHMLSLDPSEFHADCKRPTQIEEDPLSYSMTLARSS